MWKSKGNYTMLFNYPYIFFYQVNYFHITVYGNKPVKRSGMSQHQKADGNVNLEERAKGREANSIIQDQRKNNGHRRSER